MESHPDQAGIEFRLTRVLNGAALSMVSSSPKKALSFRDVELALQLDFPAPVVEEAREVAEGFGALVLPSRSTKWSRQRVSKRIVSRSPRLCLRTTSKTETWSRVWMSLCRQMRREIVEVIQPVHVDFIKDRTADQMVTSRLWSCLFHKSQDDWRTTQDVVPVATLQRQCFSCYLVLFSITSALSCLLHGQSQWIGHWVLKVCRCGRQFMPDMGCRLFWSTLASVSAQVRRDPEETTAEIPKVHKSRTLEILTINLLSEVFDMVVTGRCACIHLVFSAARSMVVDIVVALEGAALEW